MDELARTHRPPTPDTGSEASEEGGYPDDTLRADARCPDMSMAPSALLIVMRCRPTREVKFSGEWTVTSIGTCTEVDTLWSLCQHAVMVLLRPNTEAHSTVGNRGTVKLLHRPSCKTSSPLHVCKREQ